jgi:phage terminase small subunit
MFSSNQTFSISGEKNNYKTLKNTIDLFCNAYEVYPSFYEITENGKLVLSTYSSNAIAITKEDRNSDFYFQLIQLYLSSYAYKYNLYNNTFNEYKNADGCSKEGWIIQTEEDGLATNIVISPYWCFYHK